MTGYKLALVTPKVEPGSAQNLLSWGFKLLIRLAFLQSVSPEAESTVVSDKQSCGIMPRSPLPFSHEAQPSSNRVTTRTSSPVVIASSSGRVGTKVHLIIATGSPGWVPVECTGAFGLPPDTAAARAAARAVALRVVSGVVTSMGLL